MDTCREKFATATLRIKRQEERLHWFLSTCTPTTNNLYGDDLDMYLLQAQWTINNVENGAIEWTS